MSYDRIMSLAIGKSNCGDTPTANIFSEQNNMEKYEDDEEKRYFNFKESLWFCMTSLTPQVLFKRHHFVSILTVSQEYARICTKIVLDKT